MQNGQGRRVCGRMTGHVAHRGWAVHGPRLWTGAVAASSTVPWCTEAGRVGCARRGSARPRRRAMAGSGELAATATRGTGSRADGTGGLRVVRRGRCARRPRRGKARAKGPRGGGGEQLRRGLATRREGEKRRRGYLRARRDLVNTR